MALLAEEIVEEWLNRDGWFTIADLKPSDTFVSKAVGADFVELVTGFDL